jgi:hypothetical protein
MLLGSDFIKPLWDLNLVGLGSHRWPFVLSTQVGHASQKHSANANPSDQLKTQRRNLLKPTDYHRNSHTLFASSSIKVTRQFQPTAAIQQPHLPVQFIETSLSKYPQ